MNKVESVFRRLKAEGKIEIANDVVQGKVASFEAEVGLRKRIKYNERMNEQTEEDIEFGLLHEEGHFRCPVKKTDWFYLIIPLILLITFLLLVFIYLPLSLYISSIVLVLFIILYMLLYSFVYLRFWLSKFYQKYEYLADEYACRNLSNPSKRIYALKRIPKNGRNKWLEYFLIALGKKHAHPTNEQRIENIKEKFQTK